MCNASKVCKRESACKNCKNDVNSEKLMIPILKQIKKEETSDTTEELSKPLNESKK